MEYGASFVAGLTEMIAMKNPVQCDPRTKGSQGDGQFAGGSCFTTVDFGLFFL